MPLGFTRPHVFSVSGQIGFALGEVGDAMRAFRWWWLTSDDDDEDASDPKLFVRGLERRLRTTLEAHPDWATQSGEQQGYLFERLKGLLFEPGMASLEARALQLREADLKDDPVIQLMCGASPEARTSRPPRIDAMAASIDAVASPSSPLPAPATTPSQLLSTPPPPLVCAAATTRSST